MNELPDNNYDEARRLLANVSGDLRALRVVVDDEASPGRIGCFIAHLVVEKALKATLIDAEVPFGKTHDLVDLHDRCRQAGRLVDLDVGALRALNPWAVDGRYADDVIDATGSEARRAAELAEAVVAAVAREMQRGERDG